MKRISIAAVVILAVWVGSMVFLGIGAMAGSFCAGRQFVPVAAGIQLLAWLLFVILQMVNKAPTTELSIATLNFPGLVLSVAVAALGALTGQAVFARFRVPIKPDA